MTRLSVCGLGVSCNEMSDTPMLLVVADINKDIACSKLISFADDTRVYNQISDTEDCDSLQVTTGFKLCLQMGE